MGKTQTLLLSRNQLLLSPWRLCMSTAKGLTFSMQIKRLAWWAVRFKDGDLLLGGSIKDFSKETHDISANYSSMEAYLSLIFLLSNKVDYYWWWFSSCSWPTCVLTYILISNKAPDISGATVLWHSPIRDVFKQLALITRGNHRATLKSAT